MKRSQCDRILAVLQDGHQHRMEEIHQRVGFCRLNSRIAELRQRGHTIVCHRRAGTYSYQLLESAPNAPAAEAAPVGDLAKSSSAQDDTGELERAPYVLIDGQLNLIDA